MLSRYIFEGVDTVGKSTCAGYMSELGYHMIHSPYHPNMQDLEEHYGVLLQSNTDKVVFDRSFITEVVYGTVLRGYSRIDNQALIRLIQMFVQVRSAVVYLTEETEVIRGRLSKSITAFPKHQLTLDNLDDLLYQYETTMRFIQDICPILVVNSSQIVTDPLPRLLDHFER